MMAGPRVWLSLAVCGLASTRTHYTCEEELLPVPVGHAVVLVHDDGSTLWTRGVKTPDMEIPSFNRSEKRCLSWNPTLRHTGNMRAESMEGRGVIQPQLAFPRASVAAHTVQPAPAIDHILVFSCP